MRRPSPAGRTTTAAGLGAPGGQGWLASSIAFPLPPSRYMALGWTDACRAACAPRSRTPKHPGWVSGCRVSPSVARYLMPTFDLNVLSVPRGRSSPGMGTARGGALWAAVDFGRPARWAACILAVALLAPYACRLALAMRVIRLARGGVPRGHPAARSAGCVRLTMEDGSASTRTCSGATRCRSPPSRVAVSRVEAAAMIVASSSGRDRNGCARCQLDHMAGAPCQSRCLPAGGSVGAHTTRWSAASPAGAARRLAERGGRCRPTGPARPVRPGRSRPGKVLSEVWSDRSRVPAWCPVAGSASPASRGRPSGECLRRPAASPPGRPVRLCCAARPAAPGITMPP